MVQHVGEAGVVPAQRQLLVAVGLIIGVFCLAMYLPLTELVNKLS